MFTIHAGRLAMTRPVAIAGWSRRLCVAMAGALALLAIMVGSASAAPGPAPIAAPVLIPANGDTGWIGTSQFTFEKPATGKIFYTIDGTTPTNNLTPPSTSALWQEGKDVTVNHTLTVRAVHYVAGFASQEVSAPFIRAKLPTPTAQYGGNTLFYPSVLCSLFVNRDGSTHFIHYTEDGSVPTSTSAIYSTPLKIDKTLTLKAYATEPGLDDSDPMSINFTVPPPPAAPQATPSGSPAGSPYSFSTNTLTIKLKSAATGIFFRYSLDTAFKDWANAPIVSGDSISILGKNIGDTITLRAQTCKNGYPSSAIITEQYTYLPAVATPVPSRPKGFFYDTATVYLTSATQGASIRYVVDNQVLGPNSLDGGKAVFLESSTRLKAYAYKSPQPQSGTLDISYTLRLTAPVFDKSSQQFTDSLHVAIMAKAPNAAIFITLDGSAPNIHSAQIKSGDIVTVSALDSTVLRAVVIKDGIASDTTRV